MSVERKKRRDGTRERVFSRFCSFFFRLFQQIATLMRDREESMCYERKRERKRKREREKEWMERESVFLTSWVLPFSFALSFQSDFSSQTREHCVISQRLCCCLASEDAYKKKGGEKRGG
jgi:hypothetical protein